jgi:catechol 2,3-dioxygenase-like lactoylglutathione lyase family enzyme
MSSASTQSDDLTVTATGTGMPMGLEVVVIPVSDVDRARQFYLSLGWRLDADVSAGDFRVVQLTPPGSGCSVMFGSHLTTATPGSYADMHLVVSDIDAARADLVARGISVSEVYHCAEGYACRFSADGLNGRVPGRSPEGQTYGSFASFSDPDGNAWVLQEITARLPGRVDLGPASYASPAEIARALRRAAKAHGAHEARIGAADANWPEWYAEHMYREQSGEPLPL